MKALHFLLAAALAPALAVGQARGGRGSTPRGRGPAAPPPLTAPNVLQDLYQQAKRAALAAPDVAAPEQLTAIAGDEMRIFPSQGQADFATAFALARALQPPQASSQAGNDAAGQARLAIKTEVELRAVMELARLGSADQALSLTRLADVPKAPLYDQLIMAAGRGGRGARRGAKAATPSRAQEMDDVFALVQECKRSGSYPYTGVAMFIRAPGIAGLERTMLVQDGYQWAGNETAAAEIDRALVLLRAGHQAEPGLDGILASTLTALIQRLVQDPASAAFTSSRAMGERLMALLNEVDPTRAQALALQYPAAAAPALTPGSTADVSAAPMTATFDGSPSSVAKKGVIVALVGANFSADLNPAGTVFILDASQSAGFHQSPEPDAGGSAGQFRALLAQAEGLQRQDPAQALALAGQAASLLDDTLWASQTTAAMALAMLESNLGNRDEAGRLLARGLDEADRQAAAADTAFDNATPTQQAQMAQALQSAQASVLEVYSMAARLNFTAAAERAEAAQFTLLKSYVLARVALVGEVGQPAKMLAR